MSHIVGLGFPLLWLIAKCREQLSCRESHAVSVESYQSRVRARVSRPYKTKKRRLLECNILTVVPNYFIVKIYHTSSPPCSLDPLPQARARARLSEQTNYSRDISCGTSSRPHLTPLRFSRSSEGGFSNGTVSACAALQLKVTQFGASKTTIPGCD